MIITWGGGVVIVVDVEEEEESSLRTSRNLQIFFFASVAHLGL
jgi:hypothetical protein